MGQSSTEAFLVVDPKGHNAIVNSLVYSQLTDELISVSDDKTVRLWDYQEQSLNRTFRLKADPTGPIGMLYASAISEDGRYLAVGGYSKYNDIKIIDLQRSEIVVALPRHKNVINALDFSPDGKYLASASTDESIIIWEWTSGGKYPYEFKHSLYQHQSKVNDLEFSPEGDFLVSVSDDETIRMWRTDSFGSEDPVVLQNHVGAVKRVACGESGFVTGGAGGIVNFWNWQGALIQQITQFNGSVKAVEVSEFGDIAMISGDRQLLVNLQNPSRTLEIFSTDKNVTAGYFTQDNKLILGQGRSGNLITYDLVNKEPIAALRGEGKSFSSLKINRNKIGFVESGERKLTAFFDFDKEQIIRDKEEMTGFKGSTISDGTFEFQKPNNMQLIFGSGFQIENQKRDGRILSYDLLSDGRVVVGSDYTLKVYAADGTLEKELEGHNGQVLSIVSNRGFIYTYGGDQIIKVWSRADFRLKYNLFLTRDYNWVLWDNEGKYKASAGGEQYLIWQKNINENQFSEFFDVSTYGNQFMVSAQDELGNQRDYAPEIVLPAKPSVKWTFPVDFQTITEDNRVNVKATIFSDEPIEKVRILVEGKAAPDKRGISDLKQVDEIIDLTSYKTTVEIFASTANSKIVSQKRVFINPNLKNSSNSGYSVIDPMKKPNLFFIGIGISEFANPKFDLTYADDDAQSIYDIFSSGSSPVYNKVQGSTLLNEEATKANILEKLKAISQQVQPKDQVVLFVASHGINQDGFYFVLTHDADENDLTSTCLRWDELAGALGALPCRVLLFLDTCHSGALGSNLASSEHYINNTEALRELGSVEVGVVIMSGSTGEESSLESSEWEHGVFTLSLIQGLSEKKADIKGDGLIYLRELDFYVSNNVYDLTGGKQNPTTQKPSTISKLLIY